MNSMLEFTLQYGIAGIALYMMYNITYNHLTRIEELLMEILIKLS
ncbi:hypothetical protein ES708_28631 [subsurface metagenome]